MPWMVAVAGWRNLDVVAGDASKCFDCYFPKFRERIVYRGRKLWRERYLFGQYFFISFSVDRWVEAFSLPSVSKILMGSDRSPALVDDSEISKLKRCEIRGFVPVKRKFCYGDRVVVEGYGVTGFVEQSGSTVVISTDNSHVKISEDKLSRVEG